MHSVPTDPSTRSRLAALSTADAEKVLSGDISAPIRLVAQQIVKVFYLVPIMDADELQAYKEADESWRVRMDAEKAALAQRALEAANETNEANDANEANEADDIESEEAKDQQTSLLVTQPPPALDDDAEADAAAMEALQQQEQAEMEALRQEEEAKKNLLKRIVIDDDEDGEAPVAAEQPQHGQSHLKRTKTVRAGRVANK